MRINNAGRIKKSAAHVARYGRYLTFTFGTAVHERSNICWSSYSKWVNRFRRCFVVELLIFRYRVPRNRSLSNIPNTYNVSHYPLLFFTMVLLE